MNTLFYSDFDGIYKVVDFNPSHNELLFRCRKTGANECNIDILFKGVYALNMTCIYRGIHISLIDRVDAYTVNNLANRNFIFRVNDNSGLTTYIDAAAAGVFKNQLDYNLSSLGDFTWSEDNQLLLWSHEK